MDILLAFLEVTSRVPLHKRMPRADYDTHASDSVARCASCLSPNNSIMLRLACIDLSENVQAIFFKEKKRKYSLQADQRNSR